MKNKKFTIKELVTMPQDDIDAIVLDGKPRVTTNTKRPENDKDFGYTQAAYSWTNEDMLSLPRNHPLELEGKYGIFVSASGDPIPIFFNFGAAGMVGFDTAHKANFLSELKDAVLQELGYEDMKKFLLLKGKVTDEDADNAVHIDKIMSDKGKRREGIFFEKLLQHLGSYSASVLEPLFTDKGYDPDSIAKALYRYSNLFRGSGYAAPKPSSAGYTVDRRIYNKAHTNRKKADGVKFVHGTIDDVAALVDTSSRGFDFAYLSNVPDHVHRAGQNVFDHFMASAVGLLAEKAAVVANIEWISSSIVKDSLRKYGFKGEEVRHSESGGCGTIYVFVR